MSLVAHSPDEIRIRSYKVSEYEKRTRNILFAQRVKYLFNVAVFIARIERQVYHLVGITVFFVVVYKKSAVVFYKSQFGRTWRTAVVRCAYAVPVVCCAMCTKNANRAAYQKGRHKN